jgi:arginine decarboxylase-like protein
MADTVHLSLDEGHALALGALTASGFSDDQARAVADTVIAAEREGVQYDEEILCRAMKRQIDHATKKDLVKPREGVRLLELYEALMRSKTYLAIDAPVRKSRKK